MATISIPEELPLIPLKNTVLFPKIVMPLVVQRQKSVHALDVAMARDQLVCFVAQKDMRDDVSADDFYRIGVVGRVISVFRLPDGSAKVDVEGIMRVRLENILQDDPLFRVRVSALPLQHTHDDLPTQVLLRRVIDQFLKISELRSVQSVAPEVAFMISNSKDVEQIISFVAVNVNHGGPDDQQRVLEQVASKDALSHLNVLIARELEILETERSLARETKKKIGKMQREMFLREQMKSIEKELGVDDEQAEFEVLREKILAAHMPEETEAKALKELGRLSRMPPYSPETSYIRTYLDWLIELPWQKISEEKIDLKEAEKILHTDHHGMEKVKERILEYIAVKKKVAKLRGPILCFVGPPGTGKTSVGKSIARALGRTFVRMSLGGIRDEAEIRGHRRTYVGAMPGRIIQSMNNAKVKNPVIMLDEIDKIGADFRGDPSAALLEALDPEQNSSFSDHYLEVPFDLSDVLFIATANTLDTIPPALRDRLEIIRFPGYTELEKIEIAKQFILPKVLENHGLTKRSVTFPVPVLKDIVTKHTYEAGVRDLERQIATVVRKATRQLVQNPKKTSIAITPATLHTYLGPVKFTHQKAEAKDEIGVATGMVWMPTGGDVLTIEATMMPGKGRLTLTGQLGDMTRESAQAALSFARGYVAKHKKTKEDFGAFDVHIHLPSGAIKKDGPSAGTGLATALISLFSGAPVRRDVAMTGEVTLRGKVLEIGGVKEKVLGAHRAGIRHVILPMDNKKDLEDIPAEIKKRVTVHFVRTMDDVLKIALRA